jgi:hypothetical protein
MKRLIAARGASVVLTGVIVAAIAGGGYALASSGGGKINACVKKGSRTFYKAPCKKHDKKISWSQTGPKGTTGAKGATGATGSTGSTGAQGPSGVVSMAQLGSAGAAVDTTATPVFLSRTATLNFTDSRSAAEVTGTIDLASNNGAVMLSAIGVCYQESGAPSPTMVGYVEPAFVAPSGSFFASTDSGVVGNLAPGTYQVGMCARSESANVEHGDVQATVIFGETASGTTVIGTPSRKAAQAHP